MMRPYVWGLVVLLVILHHDLWNWNNSSLVFGFMPVTLAYHAGISIAASVVWYLATRYAWPENVNEATAIESTDNGSSA